MSSANTTGKRITVVTAGHLSACPRMLKSADAFAGAGYDVRVVSVNNTPWATVADAAVKKTRPWAWSVVDYDKATGRSLQLRTGVRLRMAQGIAKAMGPWRVPIAIAIRAYSRAHDEIVREVIKHPADLIYGGTTGALAAVAQSAKRLGVPYGIDFEDFHSGEHGGPGSGFTNALAARVERRVIRDAAFITAGSPMIADADHDAYGVRPLPICNTFTIVPDQPERAAGPLRLYWFSQTLGPGRGLEEVICAIGEANVPIELHMRARTIPWYTESLRALRRSVAPKLELAVHDPLMPDDMVRVSQPYDAGLACEEPYVMNKRLSLANKIFTYLAAGVPVILSRTPAQAALEPELGEAAFGYECGDVSGLSRVFRMLATDPDLLRRSRVAARTVAERRWHWEHAKDRGALLAAAGGGDLMRVLLVMDPLIAVPPRHYGGIERVIADLADGLVARGHQVTLWAGPGSGTNARLETFGEEGEWTRWSNVRNTVALSARFIRDDGRFDVVHNFGRLAYLTAIFSWNVPKVQTYMRTINPENMRKATRLGAKRMHFTAVSAAIRDTGAPGGGDWSVIYNCADPARYTFNADTDPASAPLVFLGRLDRCKGPHTAIDVARRLNRRLIIAGNISPVPHEQAFFEQEVRPRIDGSLVTYIGPVDDVQKDALLGGAAAMLMPIEWEEPFPVVLPESLLCGTPVVAFRRGGVPEGIDDGRTGFNCDTIDEMCAAVGRLPQIDRATCRSEAERRFSGQAITSDYEALYRRLIDAEDH